VAVADVENRELKVLGAYLFHMLVAQIAVENGEILYGTGKDIVCTKCTISKSNVISCRFRAAAPLAFYCRFACHVMV
jgi:hypothetical protein